MLDETTTRRSFLKGLVAAISLLSVPPSFLVETATAVEPAAPSLPVAEAGEFWCRMRGGPWHLIGGARSLDVTRDAIPTGHSIEGYTGFVPGLARMFAGVAADHAGAVRLRDAFERRADIDVALAFERFICVEEATAIQTIRADYIMADILRPAAEHTDVRTNEGRSSYFDVVMELKYSHRFRLVER